MSITIDDPIVEARLRAFATAWGKTPNQVIADLLEERGEDDEELLPDDILALQQGYDDLDAGRIVDGVAVLESLRQRQGLSKRSTGFVRKDR